MGSRRREGYHRPRRHPPVSLHNPADERSGHHVGCILMHRDGGPVHQDAPYGSARVSSSALMVSSASQMRVRRTMRARSPMRISSRDTTRLGITTTDSSSRLAQRLEIRLSQHALDHSRGAKSVFVMSQREVEMHNMESRFATLIARLEHHSRRLRGRRNTTSNRVQNR